MTKKEIEKRQKLVAKVNEAILDEPRRMNMDRFVFRKDEVEAMKQDPPCGTVACYAGWTVALAKKWDYKKLWEHRNEIEFEAGKLLGLPSTDGVTDNSLFYVNQWPTAVQDKLLSTEPGTKQYAKIVVDYVKKYFKKLDKEQLNAKAKAEHED